MVTQHYRWDFIGLSTDTKPIPDTSPKVVDGSTFYCSDTSKLYVWCQDDWYERKPLGGGGGGGSYTAGTGIDITNDTISVDTTTIQEKLTAGSNITITDNVISASGGGGDTVYSTVTTSDTSTGGAVYIGNLDSSQVEQPDPTTSDTHLKYFWALPYTNTTKPTNGSINILGQEAGNSSISIGNNAICRLENQVSIGAGALNNYSSIKGVALGYSSQAKNSHSVALGSEAVTSRDGEVNIGTGTTTNGYNSTSYRVLGGVHNPVDAHDAATKGYVDGLVLQNAGTPTTSTVGTVGQLYEDTTNGKLYQCTAIDTTDPNNPSYTWSEVGAGGGSGPTVVQTTGSSTTDVMSQNAATNMIYQDPASRQNIRIGDTSHYGSYGICIGSNAAGGGNYSIAIGSTANTYNGSDAIAIGSASRARGSGSIGFGKEAQCTDGVYGAISLGAYSSATHDGEINVGSSMTSHGYNSSNYRLISGVHDGQSAQDAVTVNQVNATIDAINTALSTNIPHIGASS